MAGVIKIDIIGDTKGLRGAVSDSEGLIGKLGSSLAGLAKTAAIAGAAIGGALAIGAGKLIGDSIGAANDMNETLSKVGVLFGDGAASIEAFGDQAASTFGQSKQQALDAAATFATFGKAAGLTGDDLVSFSTGFSGLASDLASFNNTSPEEAIEAIGAALRGEAEPIRKYGVLLDDATLRQKALELGIVKTTKEALTPQQKVLAAQAAIYEQTSAAQGDFARTSGGLANQQRILSANIDNLKTQIGQAFLPVVLNMTKTINEQVIPALRAWWSEHGPRVQEIVASIGEWIGTTLVPALVSIGSFIWEQVIPALADLVGWVRDEVVPRLQDMAAWIGDHVIPKVAAFADWVRNQLWPALKDAFAFVRDTVIPDLEDFASRVSEKLQPAIDTMTASFRDDVLPLLQGAHDKVKPLGDFITGNLVPALQAWWAGQKAVMDLLPGFIGLLGEAYREWDRVTGAIRGAITAIVDVGRKIKDLSDDAFQWGVDIIVGLTDGILSQAAKLAGTVAKVAGDVKGAFTGALSINSPSEVFKEFGRQTMAGYEIGLGEGAGRVAQVMPAMVGASIAGPAEAAPGPAGGAVYNVTINGAVGDERALMQYVREGLRRLERAQR